MVRYVLLNIAVNKQTAHNLLSGTAVQAVRTLLGYRTLYTNTTNTVSTHPFQRPP